MVVLGPLSPGTHHQCRSGPARRGLITTTRDQPGGSAMYDTESRRRTASVRAARWSATHPWRAIAMWLVFVAACFTIGQAAGTHRATDLDQTAAAQRAYPALRVEEVGDSSISKAINAEVGKSFGKATSLSLPITLLILLIAFGAIIAAGVPVLLAISAVVAAVGLSAIASRLVPDSGTTSNVILLMGMAVGVDYSLFYLKREREERARGRSHIDAIEIAAQTSGRSVIVSGLAV